MTGPAFTPRPVLHTTCATETVPVKPMRNRSTRSEVRAEPPVAVVPSMTSSLLAKSRPRDHPYATVPLRLLVAPVSRPKRSEDLPSRARLLSPDELLLLTVLLNVRRPSARIPVTPEAESSLRQPPVNLVPLNHVYAAEA